MEASFESSRGIRLGTKVATYEDLSVMSCFMGQLLSEDRGKGSHRVLGKIDLRKAYDYVDWQFLERLLLLQDDLMVFARADRQSTGLGEAAVDHLENAGLDCG
ncbi:hypothetical protein Dimus_008417 [Dionaea muscipula]